MKSLVVVSLLLFMTLPLSVRLEADERPPGITKPVVLAPFDKGAPACSRPSGLSPVLAFSQDNERKFMQGVAHGLALAARDRGLEYRVAQANNDPARMAEQVRRFLDEKVGALVIAPVDPSLAAPLLKQVIWAGAYVGAVVPPPATTVLNAPQYLVGKVLGEEKPRPISGRGLRGRPRSFF
jgi:ribose transport system substrate-binding protein